MCYLTQNPELSSFRLASMHQVICSIAKISIKGEKQEHFMEEKLNLIKKKKKLIGIRKRNEQTS